MRPGATPDPTGDDPETRPAPARSTPNQLGDSAVAAAPGNICNIGNKEGGRP